MSAQADGTESPFLGLPVLTPSVIGRCPHAAEAKLPYAPTDLLLSSPGGPVPDTRRNDISPALSLGVPPQSSCHITLPTMDGEQLLVILKMNDESSLNFYGSCIPGNLCINIVQKKKRFICV